MFFNTCSYFIEILSFYSVYAFTRVYNKSFSLSFCSSSVIRCSSPQWPDNGRLSCNLDFIYGSECTYTCDEGYIVSSPSVAVCEQDGFWSYGNEPPTCSRKHVNLYSSVFPFL